MASRTRPFFFLLASIGERASANHAHCANDNADEYLMIYYIIATIYIFECTSTVTATAHNVHGCSFLLRFSLSNIDYQDTPASLTYKLVMMTGKGREGNKGNRARKRKPWDSPLSRVICVGIAISMNTSLHLAPALTHCQCLMLSFF